MATEAQVVQPVSHSCGSRRFRNSASSRQRDFAVDKSLAAVRLELLDEPLMEVAFLGVGDLGWRLKVCDVGEMGSLNLQRRPAVNKTAARSRPFGQFGVR